MYTFCPSMLISAPKLLILSRMERRPIPSEDVVLLSSVQKSLAECKPSLSIVSSMDLSVVWNRAMLRKDGFPCFMRLLTSSWVMRGRVGSQFAAVVAPNRNHDWFGRKL